MEPVDTVVSLRVRLPRGLHERLKEAAWANRVSLNSYVVLKLGDPVAAVDPVKPESDPVVPKEPVVPAKPSKVVKRPLDEFPDIPRAKFEFAPKDCPKRSTHNSFHVCQFCGADSA